MNGGALINREALIGLLEATIEELKRNASFEGRIEYTCMPEVCERDQFVVKAFVRANNDMGQGSSMMVHGDVSLEWGPPPDVPPREPLIDAIRSCAIDSDNPDTCGVCHKHFGDCEKEVFHVATDTGWGDLEFFECPGAQVREALAKMGDEHVRDYVRVPVSVHEQVLEFHQKIGQPIVKKPAVPSDERIRLRARLVSEEAIEFLEALFDEGWTHVLKLQVSDIIDNAPVKVDFPAAIDALADIDYVVAGSAIEFGVDMMPIAAEVHRANMEKQGGPRREDGKVLKPPGWKPPDIEGELKKQGWAPTEEPPFVKQPDDQERDR